MLGVTECLVIITIILVILGGPALAREIGHLVRTLRVVGEIRREVEQATTEVQESVGEVFAGYADPLRVFVCSMQEELEPERAAVAEGLQQLGKELGLTRPILFEMLPASPDTPEEVCHQAVKRSDIFVMIVAEDVSSPALREHQFAIESKMPCFYFLKSAKQRSDPAQRFLADIAATWKEFQTPEELRRKVIFAVAGDLLENYRKHRLARTDVVALLALGERLQIGRELLERVTEQAKQEQDSSRDSWGSEMVHIPAGWFWMGTNRLALELAGIKWEDRIEREETPYHRVHLPDYAIGKYPVTNAKFARFIEDGGYRDSQYWTRAGWRWRQSERREKPSYWESKEFDDPRQPVVGMSWYEAVAYCNWLAAIAGRPYRLPSEAEWEKAARGTDGRLWPWGNRWDPYKCNSAHKGPGRPTRVGQYSPIGDSPYGVADMAGNVWEWTRNLWATDQAKTLFVYPYDPQDGREDLEASDDVIRVLRGNCFDEDSAMYLRCAFRGRILPNHGDGNNGFRIAASCAPESNGEVQHEKLPSRPSASEI